ncbi:hypothetical protein MKX01_018296 [Papaver californicum]|nr:hypothetical protein MKX01_018296 [Papaver californicum]
MAGREVREYTNLSDPKDKKFGKGKDKIDDEDVTFQRMVAKGSWLLTGWLMRADAGGCWRKRRLPSRERRQQDLLKKIVEIRPKRHRVSSPSNANQHAAVSSAQPSTNERIERKMEKELPPLKPNNEEKAETKPENPVRSLLGLAYESSDDEEE